MTKHKSKFMIRLTIQTIWGQIRLIKEMLKEMEERIIKMEEELKNE